MAKYIYIKQNNRLHFVEFTEPLNEEYFDNLGTTWQDYLNNKWVLLNDELISFHEINPAASVKEVFDMQLTPIPSFERTLELAKQEKILQIEEYDRSEAVNSFTIGNLTMWLTVEERLLIATQINANEAVGRETMTRYFGLLAFTFPLTTWKLMLIAVEVYAGDALNVTESHKISVNALETVEAVDSYDYTTNYPEKLHFSI